MIRRRRVDEADPACEENATGGRLSALLFLIFFKDNYKQSEKDSTTPTEKLSVKLNFLRKTHALKQINLSDEMIKVLKSDLESKASAKLFSSGVSFRKLANVVGSGVRISHLNRIIKNKDFGAENAKKMLKRAESLSQDVTLAAKVMIGKGLFEHLKNINDPVFVGQAILALRNGTFNKAVDSQSSKDLSQMLFRGPLITKLFEIFVDSGGDMKKSVELLKIIPFDLARKIYKAAEIFSYKLPEKMIKKATENNDFREQFLNFMTEINEDLITPGLLSNLNFILSTSISGKTMARLLEVGMSISEATQDPRYLYAVNALLKNEISPEDVIVLMEAKQTLNRLIAADEKLISSISLLLFEHSLLPSDVSQFLQFSDERCRLREVLLDSTCQNTLAELLQNGVAASTIGRFMSATGLSITEVKQLSPNGQTIEKLFKICVDVSFVPKLVALGFRISDLGALFRFASDQIVQQIQGMSGEEKETLRRILKNSLRSQECSLLLQKGNSVSDLIEVINNPVPIFNLLDDKESSDGFEDELEDEKPLVHANLSSALLYYKLHPDQTIFTTLENSFRVFVPINSVSERSYLTRASNLNFVYIFD